MADSTVTVKSSGGDYTSLNAALSGESKDLVTNTQILTIYCYAMEDTTAFDTGTGYTTSSSYYINMTSPSGERHDGKYNTEKYRVVKTGGSNAYAGCIREDHTRISYIQIVATTSGDFYSALVISATCYAYGLIIRCSGDGIYQACHGITLSAPAYDKVIKIWNCALYNTSSGSTTYESHGIFLYNYYSPTIHVFNCTSYNFRWGFRSSENSSSNTIKNCLSSTGRGSCFYGTFYTGNSNNASSDSTAQGTDARINQTFTFIDAANGDFHLSSTDAGAKGYGVSDPGSGLFSDDIDGVTRSGTWDIGADEYVAPPVGIPLHILQPQPFAHMLVR